MNVSEKEAIKNHSILEVGISGKTIQIFVHKLTPFISQFIKNPNLITSCNILIAITTLTLLYFNNTSIAGVLIITSLFIDLLDGSLARFLKKSSHRGQILDSLADIIMWSFTVTGIFLITSNNLVFYILLIYIIDVYIRNIILSDNSRSYTVNLKKSNSKTYNFIKIIFNHFDSMAILALILIFIPNLIIFWIYFECLRRSLNTLKRFLELKRIF